MPSPPTDLRAARKSRAHHTLERLKNSRKKADALVLQSSVSVPELPFFHSPSPDVSPTKAKRFLTAPACKSIPTARGLPRVLSDTTRRRVGILWSWTV